MEIDRNRTVIGQVAEWIQSYGQQQTGTMKVTGMFLHRRWSDKTWIVKLIGVGIKKNGRPGEIKRESNLALTDTPSVDLEMLLQREHDKLQKAQEEHDTRCFPLEEELKLRSDE